MAKKGKGKRKEELALLNTPTPGAVDEGFASRMMVDFPLDVLADCKLGQEVTITIRGTISMLEGRPCGLEKGCLGVKVKEKSLRKASSPQTEGLRELSDDGGEEY